MIKDVKCVDYRGCKDLQFPHIEPCKDSEIKNLHFLRLEGSSKPHPVIT